MIKQWFDKNKRDILPKIKDFKDPQDKLRNMPVKKMTYNQWFWFSPSALTLLKFGMPFAGAVQFFLLAGFFGFFDYPGAMMFFGTICLLLCFYGFYKFYNEYKIYRETTFYDLYMREY